MLQTLQISYKTTKSANLTDKHTVFSQIDTIEDVITKPVGGINF